MAEAKGEAVIVDGIDTYRLPEPLFEAVRVVLSQRGAPYSADYVQGISGAAFRIAGICPCAPTCSAAMPTQDLPALLGYEAEHFSLDVSWTDAAIKPLAAAATKGELLGENEIDNDDTRALRDRYLELLDRTKAEVRAGRAVVFWHGFTNAEFDVVCGYDDATGELLGRGSYAGGSDNSKGYARASQHRALTTAFIGGCPQAVFIGAKSGEVDLSAVEIAAMEAAVAHARSQENADRIGDEKWAMLQGLLCYDRWVADFGKPDKKRDLGDAYSYGIYRATHRAAAGFLREIAPRHTAATPELEAAAAEFEAEADALDSAEKLLWWDSPEGPDAERNEKAAEVLASARDRYAAGITCIEKALALIRSGDAKGDASAS
ncbi:MAG: hypothetical protein ACYS9X_03915 [Planctomycetota bacterium]